jgi:argininosuccinate lyase
MAGVIRTLRFHPERMQQACEDHGLLATDLADHLVRAGQPFHRAHELAGKWVSQRLDAAEQALVQPHLDRLSAPSVLAARSHPGAAGPQSVQAQLAEARQRLNSAE